jgi:hypothetical protein
LKGSSATTSPSPIQHLVTDIHSQTTKGYLMSGDLSTQDIQQLAVSLDDMIASVPTTHDPKDVTLAMTTMEASCTQGMRNSGMMLFGLFETSSIRLKAPADIVTDQSSGTHEMGMFVEVQLLLTRLKYP